MDLKPSIEKVYPEGCSGGQCGVWAHNIVDFPAVGNFVWSKRNAVKNFGLTPDKYNGLIGDGDIVIFDYGIFGHVAVNNFFDGQNIRLSESNYHNDLKIHHTRVVSSKDPHIIGIIKGNFKLPIINPWAQA